MYAFDETSQCPYCSQNIKEIEYVTHLHGCHKRNSLKLDQSNTILIKNDIKLCDMCHKYEYDSKIKHCQHKICNQCFVQYIINGILEGLWYNNEFKCPCDSCKTILNDNIVNDINIDHDALNEFYSMRREYLDNTKYIKSRVKQNNVCNSVSMYPNLKITPNIKQLNRIHIQSEPIINSIHSDNIENSKIKRSPVKFSDSNVISHDTPIMASIATKSEPTFQVNNTSYNINTLQLSDQPSSNDSNNSNNGIFATKSERVIVSDNESKLNTAEDLWISKSVPPIKRRQSIPYVNPFRNDKFGDTIRDEFVYESSIEPEHETKGNDSDTTSQNKDIISELLNNISNLENELSILKNKDIAKDWEFKDNKWINTKTNASSDDKPIECLTKMELIELNKTIQIEVDILRDKNSEFQDIKQNHDKMDIEITELKSLLMSKDNEIKRLKNENSDNVSANINFSELLTQIRGYETKIIMLEKEIELLNKNKSNHENSGNISSENDTDIETDIDYDNDSKETPGFNDDIKAAKHNSIQSRMKELETQNKLLTKQVENQRNVAEYQELFLENTQKQLNETMAIAMKTIQNNFQNNIGNITNNNNMNNSNEELQRLRRSSDNTNKLYENQMNKLKRNITKTQLKLDILKKDNINGSKKRLLQEMKIQHQINNIVSNDINQQQRIFNICSEKNNKLFFMKLYELLTMIFYDAKAIRSQRINHNAYVTKYSDSLSVSDAVIHGTLEAIPFGNCIYDLIKISGQKLKNLNVATISRNVIEFESRIIDNINDWCKYITIKICENKQIKSIIKITSLKIGDKNHRKIKRRRQSQINKTDKLIEEGIHKYASNVCNFFNIIIINGLLMQIFDDIQKMDIFNAFLVRFMCINIGNIKHKSTQYIDMQFDVIFNDIKDIKLKQECKTFFLSLLKMKHKK